MQKTDFIATPFHVCRGINADNKQHAINLIKRCQRCKSTATHADALLAPAGHCYQIIFECLTCGLRLDIFERDLYPVEDYCLETVAEPSKPSTSSYGDVDLRNISIPTPPVVGLNGTRKVLLNLPTTKIAASNITAFSNDDDIEVVDEQPTKSGVPDAAELARLSAIKVQRTYDLEQRIRADLQARETRRRSYEMKRLEAQRAKFGRMKSDRMARLMVFVDRVRQWAAGRTCNWPKIYEICQNPTHQYGINLEMLCDFYEAFIIWQSEMNHAVDSNTDPITKELASFWQFGERLACTAEFRAYFEGVCKEGRQNAEQKPPPPVPPQKMSPFLQIPLPAAPAQNRFPQHW